MICEDLFKTAILTQVVNFYLKIWTNLEIIVNVLEQNRMSVILKSETFSQKSFKIYSLSAKDRDIVNKTFNNLHAQNKTFWISQLTLFEHSVFVIWKADLIEKRKRKVVINIRDLNKIIVLNSYSMLLQIDITVVVARCSFISVIDA